MLKPLIQNLNHAAINCETLHIGGGEFAPSEIHAALEQYETLHMVATQALNALELDLATLSIKARDNLRAILAQIS
jgi:D-tyrosyl-tRNA(Tyr) deacylase